MDANKLLKLKEIKFRINRTCSNCVNNDIKGEWGTCKINTYEHKKHSESKRQLSIHRDGCCDQHQFQPHFVASIHGFSELID